MHEIKTKHTRRLAVLTTLKFYDDWENASLAFLKFQHYSF
jgi:hypothetical protein